MLILRLTAMMVMVMMTKNPCDALFPTVFFLAFLKPRQLDILEWWVSLSVGSPTGGPMETVLRNLRFSLIFEPLEPPLKNSKTVL